jgi:hypothetical protein
VQIAAEDLPVHRIPDHRETAQAVDHPASHRAARRVLALQLLDVFVAEHIAVVVDRRVQVQVILDVVSSGNSSTSQ